MSFKIIGRKNLPVNEIVLSSKNPRHHFRGASMEELKDSINSIGLIHPIIVKSLGNEKYETIAGSRRLYAFQELKKAEIPAIIIEADSEITESDIALLENLIRDDLTPIEEAKAYMNRWNLMKKDPNLNLNWDNIPKTISKELNIPHSRVYTALCLLKLPEPIQNAIHLGTFKKTYGYEISRLSTHEEMKVIYKKIKANGKKWNTIKIKEYIDEILEEKDSKTTQKRLEYEKTIVNLRNGLEPLRDQRNKILSDFVKYFRNIKQYLEEEDKEKCPEETQKIIKAIIKKEKTSNETIWKEFQIQTENIQKRLNSISALLSQVEELDITVCPFCEAGIEIPAIKRKESKLREGMDNIEEKQANLNKNLQILIKLEQDFSRAKLHLQKQQKEIGNQLKEIVKYRKRINDLERE